MRISKKSGNIVPMTKKVQAEIPASQYGKLEKIAEHYDSTIRNVVGHCVALSLEAWEQNPDLFAGVPRDGRRAEQAAAPA